jgi:hypothetical protein
VRIPNVGAASDHLECGDSSPLWFDFGRAMPLSYVEPVAVGDRLPDMAVYLDPDSNVRLPLEATYEST